VNGNWSIQTPTVAPSAAFVYARAAPSLTISVSVKVWP